MSALMWLLGAAAVICGFYAFAAWLATREERRQTRRWRDTRRVK